MEPPKVGGKVQRRWETSKSLINSFVESLCSLTALYVRCSFRHRRYNRTRARRWTMNSAIRGQGICHVTSDAEPPSRFAARFFNSTYEDPESTSSFHAG
jgi:hypothetical protein